MNESSREFRKVRGQAVCLTAGAFYAAHPYASAWLSRDWVEEIALCLQCGSKADELRGGRA